MRSSITKVISNSGDTIVEVLIAITIISSILGGAYVAVNSSLNGSQDSLERSAGTKLAEAQIERLKSISDDDINEDGNAAIFVVDRVFCMDTSNEIQDFANLDDEADLPPMDTDILNSPPDGNYPPACIIDNANNLYDPASRSTPYYVSIERDPVAGHHKFIARARWQGTGNKGIQEASVAYVVF